MTFLTAFALLASAGASANTVDLQAQTGVNLSGCEFDAVGTLCPNADDVDWYLGQGFTVVRLPFRGTIAPARLQPIIDRIVAKGGYVILDRHDFNWPSPIAQIAFWNTLAGRYKGEKRVLIDVMNEPKGFNDPVVGNDFMQWARDSNVILAGLRASGLRNTVLLEWPQYSAAFRFDKKEGSQSACESAACALDRSGGLQDPLNATLLSPHLYFDSGSSGTNGTCQPILNLDKARTAAAARGYRLFLGESAFGNATRVPASCAGVGAAALAEIKSYPETWAGVTWWGGGRAWKEDYLFKIEPRKGTRGQVEPSAYLRAITNR